MHSSDDIYIYRERDTQVTTDTRDLSNATLEEIRYAKREE